MIWVIIFILQNTGLKFPSAFLMMYSVNIWLIIELNLRWREIKVSTKYPITSNTPNSILTKSIRWKIKMLLRVNYIEMHPTFTSSNKDHKTIHIHEKYTFVILQGVANTQQTSFQTWDKRTKEAPLARVLNLNTGGVTCK